MITNQTTLRRPNAEEFRRALRLEIDTARQKHRPIHSIHEGYAVILEELGEFWEEVRRKTEDRNDEAMFKELVQIAAMAMRTATDCVFLRYSEED